MSDLESPDGKVDDQGWLPPMAAERNIADLARDSQPRIYSAPRRFDLPTIFAVTTAYALLFAGLGALRLPAVASAGIAGFITLIGVGQLLLFGGKSPRAASMVTGATIALLMMLALSLTGLRHSGPGFIMAVAWSTLGGAMQGYLAGTFVGGVFLVADVLRGRFGRREL